MNYCHKHPSLVATRIFESSKGDLHLCNGCAWYSLTDGHQLKCPDGRLVRLDDKGQPVFSSMEVCDDCEGTGHISVTYSEVRGSGCGMSNDQAMNMAGAHHHSEECDTCNGEGEVEVDE